MLRWVFFVGAISLFALFPILWTQFPDGCSDGHVHYAPHTHDDDGSVVEEPWHCHYPRRCGLACTPSVDCLLGGMYGPTANGGLLMLLVLGALGAALFCSFGPEEVEYVSQAVPSAAPARNAYRSRRGLADYPIR